MDLHSSLYENNLELFAEESPFQAALLDTIDYSGMEFCFTEAGELNLVDNHPEGKRYIYAPEGAYKEAELWAKIPPLQETDVLFVFGLGLGYYYFPLKKWLEGDLKRQLVFLEDDLRVIRFFLATEWAEEILKHPQVMIKPIPEVTPDDAGWSALSEMLGVFPQWFSMLRPNISALQGYFMYRFPYFHLFATQWLTILGQGMRKVAAYSYDPYKRFRNFYFNLPYAGRTIPGERMEGSLRGIPAVLCGAGGSLDKQLPLLSKLFDKAFLMAPASGMNPLLRASIIPHAGGGIDPTVGQLSRLMARSGNDVPLIYEEFFNHLAFLEWHGPKIHLSKESGFGISKWFERAIGMADDKSVVTGPSTSNYLLEAAAHLGCNPIVMVGMDLSFSNSKRYSEGVGAHPTDEKWLHDAIVRKDDGLISFPGYNGKDVVTSRHWFLEAACISSFRQRHPEISLVNCTEGGLRILHVDEKPFNQTVEEELCHTWDIQGWFHGEAVNAAAMEVGEAPVFAAIAEWEKSLIRCSILLDALIAYFEDKSAVPVTETIKRVELYSGPAALYQVELMDEPAYVHLFLDFNAVYEITHFLEKRSWKRLLSSEEFVRYEYKFESRKSQTLLDRIRQHIDWLQEGVADFKKRRKDLEEVVEGALTVKDFHLDHGKELYEANEGRLRIEDEELGISIAAEFDPQLIPKERWPNKETGQTIEACIGELSGKREGLSLYFYEDGTLKAEAYYHHGRLNGPWTYYSKQGDVLSRSWFVEGVREGKTLLFDSEGRVYSRQGYRGGVREGRQLYFYPSGVLKSSEYYSRGVLDGALILYHENGRVKLEQNFVDGKLDGVERFYDIHGMLYAEAYYQAGHPVGVSRRWHSNGVLAREVTHSGDRMGAIEWSEKGELITK